MPWFLSQVANVEWLPIEWTESTTRTVLTCDDTAPSMLMHLKILVADGADAAADAAAADDGGACIACCAMSASSLSPSSL